MGEIEAQLRLASHQREVFSAAIARAHAEHNQCLYGRTRLQNTGRVVDSSDCSRNDHIFQGVDDTWTAISEACNVSCPVSSVDEACLRAIDSQTKTSAQAPDVSLLSQATDVDGTCASIPEEDSLLGCERAVQEAVVR